MYEVRGEVWRHPGQGGWHFLTLPPDVADEIRARTAAERRPFGTAPVRARLGSTAWDTSVFVDTARDSYLLPLKADVRLRERVGAGDVVTVRVELRA